MGVSFFHFDVQAEALKLQVSQLQNQARHSAAQLEAAQANIARLERELHAALAVAAVSKIAPKVDVAEIAASQSDPAMVNQEVLPVKLDALGASPKGQIHGSLGFQGPSVKLAWPAAKGPSAPPPMDTFDTNRDDVSDLSEQLTELPVRVRVIFSFVGLWNN
jgi:hypothetical protein